MNKKTLFVFCILISIIVICILLVSAVIAPELISESNEVKIKDYLDTTHKIKGEIVQVNKTASSHRVILMDDGRKIIISDKNYNDILGKEKVIEIQSNCEIVEVYCRIDGAFKKTSQGEVCF